MRRSAPKVPDYRRLCELARRVPELDPDAVFAFAKLRSVGARVEVALQASLERRGISEGRLRVLATLLSRDAALTHTELAELAGVTKGTITGLVDGLEGDGLVRRVAEAADARVRRVELTRRGRALLDRVLPGHLAGLSACMAGLSRAERRQLARLLAKVEAGLPGLT